MCVCVIRGIRVFKFSRIHFAEKYQKLKKCLLQAIHSKKPFRD